MTAEPDIETPSRDARSGRILLQTRGLTRNFGGVCAVDRVSFELAPREIRALIGPNGAGKTTLASLLSGRLRPSAGAIYFDGQYITDLPASDRVALGIAYTFQITSVFGALSVADNVALAAQRRLQLDDQLTDAALGSAVSSALERVGLPDDADRRADALDYGRQRLLEVAMGVALRPKLLILDEPTQGLSDAEVAHFLELARRLADTSTLLLVEHNMDVVMALADRITVMDQGAILAEGPPADIRANAAVRSAYLGT